MTEFGELFLYPYHYAKYPCLLVFIRRGEMAWSVPYLESSQQLSRISVMHSSTEFKLIILLKLWVDEITFSQEGGRSVTWTADKHSDSYQERVCGKGDWTWLNYTSNLFPFLLKLPWREKKRKCEQWNRDHWFMQIKGKKESKKK